MYCMSRNTIAVSVIIAAVVSIVLLYRSYPPTVDVLLLINATYKVSVISPYINCLNEVKYNSPILDYERWARS